MERKLQELQEKRNQNLSGEQMAANAKQIVLVQEDLEKAGQTVQDQDLADEELKKKDDAFRAKIDALVAQELGERKKEPSLPENSAT